jgi:hypothetical protein
MGQKKTPNTDSALATLFITFEKFKALDSNIFGQRNAMSYEFPAGKCVVYEH